MPCSIVVLASTSSLPVTCLLPRPLCPQTSRRTRSPARPKGRRARRIPAHGPRKTSRNHCRLHSLDSSIHLRASQMSVQ